MPQATAITVPDRKATPVNHVFNPNGQLKDGSWLFTETAGTKIGERRLSVAMRKAGSNYKVRLLLTDPVVGTEVINGVSSPKTLRTSFADVTFTFSELSTLDERKDTVGMFSQTLLAYQTMLDSVITKLEALY